MERYDYEAAVKSDLADFIKECVSNKGWNADEAERNRDELRDDAFVADGVTGNGSGSYTFSTWTAEENVCHNLGLVDEVISEFGEPSEDKRTDAEYWDVSIRCLMLGRVFDAVLGEVLAEMRETENAEEE